MIKNVCRGLKMIWGMRVQNTDSCLTVFLAPFLYFVTDLTWNIVYNSDATCRHNFKIIRVENIFPVSSNSLQMSSEFLFCKRLIYKKKHPHHPSMQSAGWVCRGMLQSHRYFKGEPLKLFPVKWPIICSKGLMVIGRKDQCHFSQLLNWAWEKIRGLFEICIKEETEEILLL